MIWGKDIHGKRYAAYADKTMPPRSYKPPSAELIAFRREERILQEQSKLIKAAVTPTNGRY